MERDTLLSTCDVAKLAGVTPEAVRKWARVGRLPVAVRSESGINLFRRRDAERIVRARRKRVNGA